MDYSGILLTVDYDRTLTAPDETVPRRNIEAIRYFMDHGGTFTVNTGRSLPMARGFMDQIPHNAPLLLYNGSAAYENGKLTLCHPIELDMAKTLTMVMEGLPDLNLEVQGTAAHYAFRKNPYWEAFCAGQGADYAYANVEDDLGVFLKFSFYGEFIDASVARLFQATPEEMKRMDEAEAWLKAVLGDKAQVFRAGARIIDVHAGGVSKKLAARELQARLGSKILICVGDAHNDLAMLEDADYAYCPADGAVADRFENVCACAEGAVADVIYKKIPEILRK
ncbi:MAG: HAD family phosphatase [Oscillospiraceae bacterium]|nr:HAD family phosphatase [Oscillospiraceae bacterium]